MRKLCSNCKYYVQHYMKANNYMFAVPCGHCTSARKKTRTPKPCEHWVEVSEEERPRADYTVTDNEM